MRTEGHVAPQQPFAIECPGGIKCSLDHRCKRCGRTCVHEIGRLWWHPVGQLDDELIEGRTRSMFNEHDRLSVVDRITVAVDGIQHTDPPRGLSDERNRRQLESSLHSGQLPVPVSCHAWTHACCI